MKNILLFGAGKSATCLIEYFVNEVKINDWQLTVADNNLELIQSKIGQASNTNAVAINIENESARKHLVERSDIVISLLPPALHFLIAKDCVEFKKNLLTASYIDDNIRKLEPEIIKNKLLFLCEMGLDPGIDHMSVMQLVNKIENENGRITSFKSHTGGLVAPESDNNPWHYKISWNPRNVVLAGSSGAIYKENGEIKNTPYENLFENCKTIQIDDLGKLAYYPNRNSLNYIDLYKFDDPNTFIRTTLRYPEFCNGWKTIVAARLTDDKKNIKVDKLTFKDWSSSIIPYVNSENKNQLSYLGLFDDELVPSAAKTSADILQHLLETKLAMQPHDKDMIVMLHELEYGLKNTTHKLKSSLIVIGENNIKTAMAKTVGLPLGIAAKLILQKKINLMGMHIPILPEIYEPVLEELKNHGIVFKEIYS
ncbi:MAG TPA: saccharopine dehydrogenase C-terminal domain-containing protein [Puia sp.]|jgi:saccharopine dehydrogenase-like NADP-dependent oxidoreductase|nr:saccharopine dehydrogenase C-terminal domain-containing protein [Puia sp.]